jgi:mycothiol synthase
LIQEDQLPAPFQLKPLNLRDASPAEYAALNRHNNKLRRERLPDDPPIPLDEMIQGFKNIPSFIEVKIWCAWDQAQTEIIAQGNVVLMRTNENQHITQVDLTVLPEYRRQGVGRRLLALLTEAARADGRRLLISETFDRLPGGAAFMSCLGAKKGIETHINQLRMDELDHSLLERWLVQGKDLANEFNLGLWEGPYPEDQLSAVIQLNELTNQVPLGDLEIEAAHMTPEQLRESEQYLFACGYQRWTFYVVEKASGKFSGYTEATWNPNRPDVLNQDMTGVFPEYRNRGLGRWLKAAMLEKVLKEHPEIRYVRTGNADTNAAMLKINNELGFKPYLASTFWQVEIEHVLEYLGETRSCFFIPAQTHR